MVIRQSWFVVKFADLSFFWVMNNGIQGGRGERVCDIVRTRVWY